MSSVALTVAAALAGLGGIGMQPSMSLPWTSPQDSMVGWALVEPGSLRRGDFEEPAMDLSEDVVDEVSEGFFARTISVDGCELTLDGDRSALSWESERPVWTPLAPAVENGHREKSGRWIAYEQIPRRAERPESYVAYRYPVADAQVVSGYDLDKPDAEQRRGTMNAVGHGGVDLAAERGTPVVMVRLANQVGDAEVLHVGWLFGETVVTRHAVREGGKVHDYLLLFGHLDGVGIDVRRGQRLPEGTIVGLVGDSGSPEHVHLHLEARRGRDGVDMWKVAGDELNARDYSVVVDPRNVLPLARVPRRPSRCLLRPATTPATRYRLGQAMKLTVDLGSAWRPEPLF